MRGFVVLGGEGFGPGMELTVTSSVVLLCSERLRPFQQRDGRNTVRSGVEHDQPPADDRRRGDVKYSGFGVRPPYGY